MSEPMYAGYYKITWSEKRQKFVVKSINGTNVLYESTVGKECYDWANEQGKEKKIHYSALLDLQSMCGRLGQYWDNRIQYVTCKECLDEEKWHLENVSPDAGRLLQVNARIEELDQGEEE